MRVGVDLRCLADPQPRGWARYTLELTRHLREVDDLEVLGFTDSDLVADPGVPIHRFGADREIVREQVALPRALWRSHIDVFLAPANRGLALAAPCPGVLTLHDPVEWEADGGERPAGKSRARFAYANLVSLSVAARIITVSRHSAAELVRVLGLDRRRIAVVPEAASDEFRRERAPEDVRRVGARHGVDRRTVLYVGGFDRKKDVPTLVRAFARLDHGLEARLALAGPPAGDAEARALAESLGVADRVGFLGFVAEADLPLLYRAVGCLAFPAVAEGFGLPVVEAMASALPVVAADAGALPEVVGAGGRLFAPGDDREAAGAIESLLADERERERWSGAALRRAGELSWEDTARETARVLEAAVAMPAGTRVAASVRSLRAARRWTGVQPGGSRGHSRPAGSAA